MYGILTFISFSPIFVVSYFRDDLFAYSYELFQTVTKFTMFKGFNKRNDLLFNPWYDVDPETNEPRRRDVRNFLAQFDWEGMYDWLQVRYSFPIATFCMTDLLHDLYCSKVLLVSLLMIMENSSLT